MVSAPRTARVTSEVRVRINSDPDIVTARQIGRALAMGMGFSTFDSSLIAAAISELARNIVMYAKPGEIVLKPVTHSEKQGIVMVAKDEGPGIQDVAEALKDGYSTSRGLGLPGVRRVMDEFEIASRPGQGTTVTVTKWKK